MTQEPPIPPAAEPREDEEPPKVRVTLAPPASPPENRAPNLSAGHLFDRALAAFKQQPVFLALAIVAALVVVGNGGPTIRWANGGLHYEAKPLALVAALLAGPIYFGLYSTFLAVLRGQEAQPVDLFSGFDRFVDAAIVHLLFTLITGIGLILLVVPGIVLSMGLGFSYVIASEEKLGPIEALKASWALTDGHKMDIFVLAIVFLALLAAGLLMLGIGSFVTSPIGFLMIVGAYDELAPAQQQTRPAPDAA